MSASGRPSVLFVYYSYTGQTLKLTEVISEVLEARGCDVTLAPIEFTDPRYSKRFAHFPMKRPFLEVAAMIPAEVPGRSVTISIPDSVSEGTYDYVVVGAPTWWLSTDVPIRSFLESATAKGVMRNKPFTAIVTCRRYWKHNIKTVQRLGTKNGGIYAEGMHCRYEGGQVRSLFALLSYLGTGEYKDSYMGVRIPHTNLQEYHLVSARRFADALANTLLRPS